MAEKFVEHAKAFGIMENYSLKSLARFQKAIADHMLNPGVKVIQGTFRKTIPAIHYYDPATGNVVITNLDGSFISGWHLALHQVKDLLTRGNIQ